MFDEVALDEDLGEWKTFGKDKSNKDEKTGEPKLVQFRIRVVPDEELQRIRRRHFGKRQRYELEKGGKQATELDLDSSQLSAIDKAVYACTGSRNFRIRPKADSVEAYTTLLGRAVKAGEWIDVDEHVTREIKDQQAARPLKEHVFRQFDALISWINDKSDAQKIHADEDEAALKS